MRPRIAILTPLVTIPLLVGCRGKLLATAELHGAGTADVHFASTGAPVVLWTDTDGKWRTPGMSGRHPPPFPVHYEIDVLSKGVRLGHVACDTKGSAQVTCGVVVNTGDTHSGDCEAKLACTLPAIPVGDAALHVVGTTGTGVIEVTNMSINVRTE